MSLMLPPASRLDDDNLLLTLLMHVPENITDLLSNRRNPSFVFNHHFLHLKASDTVNQFRSV